MNGLDGREKQHSNIWWSANDFRARAFRNWTSYTFAGAPNFKQFMLTYDRGRVVWRGWNPDRNVSDWINKIEPGDLVIADLHAKPGERLLASHNMFVTTVRPGKKFVGLTYHGANNPADRNFFDIVRRYRHPDPDDPDGFYWIVRITNSGPEPDEAFYWPDYKHL